MSERIYRKLDLSGLHFPSDSLTIRILRTAHGELFDQGVSIGGGDEQPQFFFKSRYQDGHSGTEVGNLLYLERVIAAFAFATAAGIDPPSGQVSIKDFKDELAERYVRYGLASGPKHAAELIRGIERQGRGLAAGRKR